MGDFRDQVGFVHLEGDLVDNDCLSASRPVFDVPFGADFDTAASVFHGLGESVEAMYNGSGWKVGRLEDVDDVRDRCIRPVDQQYRGVDDGAQIVGRDR